MATVRGLLFQLVRATRGRKLDGCGGGFIQRGIAGSPDAKAILETGGASAESSESRVTEASVRGFWKAYRARMYL